MIDRCVIYLSSYYLSTSICACKAVATHAAGAVALHTQTVESLCAGARASGSRVAAGRAGTLAAPWAARARVIRITELAQYRLVSSPV